MADRNATVYYRGTQFSTREGMVLTIPLSNFDWKTVNGGVPSSIDPASESISQLWPFGTRLQYGEKIFRYAGNAAVALDAGKVIQQAALVSGHELDMVTAAAAVGDTTVTVTPVTTNITANQYQDGYLFGNDQAGEGINYQVLSNPAITATATGVLTLKDPIHTAWTSSVQTGLRKNPYDAVIVVPVTTMTGIPVGVVNKNVTASYYFWLQTRGPAAIFGVGSLVAGHNATMNLTTTAGSVKPDDGNGTLPVIGRVMTVAVTTEHSLIFVTLE